MTIHMIYGVHIKNAFPLLPVYQDTEVERMLFKLLVDFLPHFQHRQRKQTTHVQFCLQALTCIQ